MNKLFLMTEYPSDVLPMYAQGYSVCQFLIAQQGARGFVEFLGDYMQKPSWTQHVRSHYGYESLAELQEAWLAWVAEGGGPVDAYVKQPAVSPQAQVAAVPPAQRPAASGLQPIDSLAAAPSAIALASATERDAGSRDAGSRDAGSQAGWYSRLRQQTLGGPGGSAGGRSPAPRPTAEPPSLHSVSQPQPEQGLAPGGLVPGQSTPHPPVAAERDGYRPGSLSTSGSYWR